MISCACDECKEMCGIPCWPTPDEAKALIGAGYADRMMSDYWDNVKSPVVYVLCPACPGNEGGNAGFMRDGCVFQSKDGFCELHDAGLKPIEARLNFACREIEIKREDIMKMWDNPEARSLVEAWWKR